jgi:multidrug efflux pump subunit AcrA (membrane-fusion protein)
MKLRAFRASTAGRRHGLLVLVLLAGLLAALTLWRRTDQERTALVATVERGDITAVLTLGGTLEPIEAITYRSPLAGREVEIVDLVPEGVRVEAGDRVAQLDTSDLMRDAERVRQELRQGQMDLQVAEIDRAEAEAAIEALDEGEGALTVEEARTNLQLAERKVDRLREEYGELKPLLDRGFITREELRKCADELEQAEQALTLARKRTTVVVQVAHPRDRQRAALLVAQKNAQLENAMTRVRETQARLALIDDLVARSSLYARRPGLVVYEEFLAASPRRKIRVGDRVTASQGILTIPEVDRMLMEGSVGEAEVHRVHRGQTAVVRVEAFPDLRLPGKVIRVGTLARTSVDRPFDDKRFDLVIELDASPAELRPEMTARADIVVANRKDVLLVPVNAVFGRPGAFVAYVPGRSGTETRPVDLGESNDRFVEVVAGLRQDERVLLTEPDDGGRGPLPAGSRPVLGPANALQPR